VRDGDTRTFRSRRRELDLMTVSFVHGILELMRDMLLDGGKDRLDGWMEG